MLCFDQKSLEFGQYAGMQTLSCKVNRYAKEKKGYTYSKGDQYENNGS